MKNIFIIIFIIILLLSNCINKKNTQTNSEKNEGIITVSGAWALYPMVIKWAEEYQKIHPKVKVDISAGGAGKGMADCLAEVVDIGMVSRAIYPEEIQKGAWWVSVTKDAVVPTVNAKNPILDELMIKGVSRDILVGIWISGEIQNWEQVTQQKSEYKIHVYTRSDACGAAQTWAAYLGKNQEDLRDVGVYGDPGLAEAVKNDILGIGFNNINYAYDSKTKKAVTGIEILPIDLNSNGKIDEDEAFYQSLDEIVHAIAIGKYPSPPARDLHLVSLGKPKNKVVREFIKWILTKGQKHVPEAGYIKLSEGKLQEELNKLESM
jgi:phosphate transport system substrate-binding protein